MDIWEESSRLESLASMNARNLSSSSSAFYSANHSPFFSPRSPSCQSSAQSDIQYDVSSVTAACTSSDFQKFDRISSSRGISNSNLSIHSVDHGNDHFGLREKQRKIARSQVDSFPPTSSKMKSYDVYIGFHGHKPVLLRFTNWLRAELEVQGLSCFVTDRSRSRNYRKHDMSESAMDACTFGVVILTRKSFKNLCIIEELHFFSSKNNLVPVYFDLGADDCLVRDIIEKRGELWERNGGELWLSYGGLEKEWKDAVNALSQVDEWKLEAKDGKWRDCILRAVILLSLRLGRRSIVDRLSKWREKAEKEEFPFPRNENFVGRKKELSELEFMLFGDVSGDSEKDYFELKARRRRKKLTINWSRSSSLDGKGKERKAEPESSKRKGKEPIVWKESGKEIEMESTEVPQIHRQTSKFKHSAFHGRRKRSMKVVYGKGIACVTGDSGIGKTELILEYAYRFHQKYKMVLWVGGESRYIRQNYLNLWSFLEVDVGIESGQVKHRIKNFEEKEESAIARVRKELMQNIPFLLVIDNLESEKDWWDHKLIMDLLPRFGGETHVIISTRHSRLMNLEPLRLSNLSGVEGMSLMQGGVTDHSITEIDALRVVEEKLGRLTLGLAIVGAILSELPINPTRLLDTINRTPLRDMVWAGRGFKSLRQNNFLLQLFEVCFSIFDCENVTRSLATRMVLASGWFAPSPIPVSLLALAARKLPEKHHHTHLWKRTLRSLACGLKSSYASKSEAEASLLLTRFNIVRSCNKEGFIQFNELTKLYARKRGDIGVAKSMVQAVITRGPTIHHSEHLWAACFLLFGFGKDPIVVEVKVSQLLFLVKELILPLAVKTFTKFSRCKAALELLRLSTNAVEEAEQAFVTPVAKWFDKSFCLGPIKTRAQLNPSVWKELALSRATLLEIRAKLMVKGGQFDIADDLIRKAIFVRSTICGEDHPDTISAQDTLGKVTRLLANATQSHTSP